MRKHIINKVSTLILMLISVASAACAQTSDDQRIDIVILGDSNMWLAGDDCSQPRGSMTWFRQAMAPASCRSYARSGASWSNTPNTAIAPEQYTEILDDNNVIYNQVVRLCQACDSATQVVPSLIVISAGGNDAWFAHRRAHEFDLTVDQAFAVDGATLCSLAPSQVLSLPGAIRQNVLMLREAFPEAQIVLLTPTPMSKVEPEMVRRVADIIAESAERLSVPVIRLDGDSPISRDQELREHVNTYDGIHTNETGARRVGEYVADQVKSILSAKDR